MKRQKQSPRRFEAGTYGGCHTRIREFDEQRSPDPQVVRIAAAGFDEVLAYLHWVDLDSSKSRARRTLDSM
jgi:hypothetical protein